MSLSNGLCDRCGKRVKALRMSMFCTEMCCQACLTKESRHPDYKKAVKAEREECEKGNYNFQGIGRPSDL